MLDDSPLLYRQSHFDTSPAYSKACRSCPVQKRRLFHSMADGGGSLALIAARPGDWQFFQAQLSISPCLATRSTEDHSYTFAYQLSFFFSAVYVELNPLARPS